MHSLLYSQQIWKPDFSVRDFTWQLTYPMSMHNSMTRLVDMSPFAGCKGSGSAETWAAVWCGACACSLPEILRPIRSRYGIIALHTGFFAMESKVRLRKTYKKTTLNTFLSDSFLWIWCLFCTRPLSSSARPVSDQFIELRVLVQQDICWAGALHSKNDLHSHVRLGIEI